MHMDRMITSLITSSTPTTASSATSAITSWHYDSLTTTTAIRAIWNYRDYFAICPQVLCFSWVFSRIQNNTTTNSLGLNLGKLLCLWLSRIEARKSGARCASSSHCWGVECRVCREGSRRQGVLSLKGSTVIISCTVIYEKSICFKSK